eukprot:GHUV01009774.1.p1 GENE.GHUV01009774.1~~GHUV01009774.1.p1  ORF type:complete len:377 (+),score=87.89 GHUV01009774.1:500-1630(+)
MRSGTHPRGATTAVMQSVLSFPQRWASQRTLASRVRTHRCFGRAALPARALESCQAQDVLEVKMCDGSTETMEVAQGWDTAKHSAIVMTQGQLLQLAAIGGQQFGNLQLAALGEYLHADSLIVAHFPELSKVLPTMVSEQLQGAGPLSVNSAAVVESMDRLTQQVQTDAAFWRDGTAPGDPIKTAVQQAVFTAGELAALLAGQRGVTMVQLWNGWDPTKGQPIYNPLAITMLEKVLTAPGISCCSSVAPGGVGLTGIVYADREPFASWALHLASFGCQANVVAGSSYYKLLIGQLLGYKLENVLGYVAASGEPASPALQQQVARDIKNLSKVKPKLPWSADDKNVRKARTANKAVTEKRTGGFSSNKPAAGFGAKA